MSKNNPAERTVRDIRRNDSLMSMHSNTEIATLVRGETGDRVQDVCSSQYAASSTSLSKHTSAHDEINISEAIGGKNRARTPLRFLHR